MEQPKGFSLVEALLIVLIVGAVGGIGWYVWDTKLKEPQSSTTNTKQSDPTANWVAYSNNAGQYSLKYPSSWQRPDNEQLCNPELLMLGPTKQSAGTCGSENFGQMFVLSVTVGNPSDFELKTNDGYKDIKSEKVTVAGVEGTRQSAVAFGQSQINEVAPLSDNTIVVEYVFFTNGRVYAATYKQAASNQDVLSDFDLMISQTLKFSG